MKFESEFLILAGQAFGCRYQIMGGYVIGKKWAICKTSLETLSYQICGEMDNLLEMRLLCEETKLNLIKE